MPTSRVRRRASRDSRLSQRGALHRFQGAPVKSGVRLVERPGGAETATVSACFREAEQSFNFGLCLGRGPAGPRVAMQSRARQLLDRANLCLRGVKGLAYRARRTRVVLLPGAAALERLGPALSVLPARI